MDQESTATAERTDPESGAGAPQEGTPRAETQTEGEPKVYDAAYVKSLRSEAAQARTRLKDAEEQLRELQDRDKSEAQRLADRATEAETRATNAETRLLRYEIAAAKELPPKVAALLAGNTKDEIEAHADALKAWAAEEAEKAKPSPPKGFDGGARTTPETTGTPEQQHTQTLLEALGRAPQR